MSPSAFATMRCEQLFAPQKSESLLGVEFPEMVFDIKSQLESGEMDPKKTFFVLLPGNMGATWQNTNHNIGYDLLVPLLQVYHASGVAKGEQNYANPVETVRFNSKEKGDDVELVDQQSFYSESQYARTDSGEMFVGRRADGVTLVFMRRVGFYNDVGNFFIPSIREMGGQTQNIIVIHDNLKGPLGTLAIELSHATYDGNRAILSVHNNLNALRLDRKLQENESKIAELLLEAKSSRVADFSSLLWSLRKVTWQTVVEMKNTGANDQFVSSLTKKIKEPLLSYLQERLSSLEPSVSEAVKQLNLLKSQISKAEDKRAAAQEFQSVKREMTSEQPLLAEYFAVSDLLADVGSKKSQTIKKIIESFAQDFDPRVMKEPFTAISVGTGYNTWLKKGQESGFPPISEHLNPSDFAGYPHFVLSQRSPYFEGSEFLLEVVTTLNNVIDILAE